MAGQAQPRVERARPCRGCAGTRRPGRASSRSRSRARPGRAGGRRDSSRPRSGWYRTTCEGAWPGVSWTCQAPRSVSTSTPGTSSRSGSTTLGDAEPWPRALLGLAAQRLEPARRSGAPPRCAARARARGPAPRASCARGAGASTARSRRARRSAPPARSGRSARGCRPAAARPRAAGRPGRARARAGAARPARGCRCRPARCRRRPRSPTRSRAARPATAAAAAAARAREHAVGARSSRCACRQPAPVIGGIIQDHAARPPRRAG